LIIEQISGGGGDGEEGEGEGVLDLQFAEEYVNWGFVGESFDGIVGNVVGELWKGATHI
jgi:hypothetical protein